MTQIVNFPNCIPDCDSYIPVLFGFISCDPVICSVVAIFPLGNSDHVFILVSIDLLSYSKGDASFYCITFDYSHADWDSLHDHLKDVLWEDIFKLGTSVAAELEWVRDVINNVYILLREYKVKPHSPCAAVIAYRNHTTLYSILSKGKSAIPPLFYGPGRFILPR